MSVELLNESEQPFDELRIQQLAAFVLEQMQVHPLAQLCITAVDSPTMATLNQRWMGEDEPTDVLAFPMDELEPYGRGSEPTDTLPVILGDVVLCPQIAAAQAERVRQERPASAHTTQDELDLLTVHGILHLLGYDHAEPEEQTEMFGLQARLLAQWSAHQSQTAHPDR